MTRTTSRSSSATTSQSLHARHFAVHSAAVTRPKTLRESPHELAFDESRRSLSANRPRRTGAAQPVCTVPPNPFLELSQLLVEVPSFEAREPAQDRHRYAGCAKRNRPRSSRRCAAVAASTVPRPLSRSWGCSPGRLTATHAIPINSGAEVQPLVACESSSGDVDRTGLHSRLD